ncbi:MAG: hypothetical protein AAF586_07270 [Planctomycetota bacterium]
MPGLTLDPSRRTWHITFGTYATRLHNDPRPTVDRRHNRRNTPFPAADPPRQRPPSHPPLYLTLEQRRHAERQFPDLCERGGWRLRAAAAPDPGDHIHILLDAKTNADPKSIRRWLKRWLGESLSETFDKPSSGWWAEGGSTKPVTDQRYLINVTKYVLKQRTNALPHRPG